MARPESEHEECAQKRVIIVGGGLVGALNASYFARRNFQVEVYDSRPDPRTEVHVVGRSINMALSNRGREGLRRVNLEEEVVSAGTRMYARMIHDRDGRLRPIPYGTKPDQYLMAVDRRRLNEILISGAETYSNVKFFFKHRLVRCDADSGECTFDNNGTTSTVSSDLIVGCDGAYSAVRRELGRKCRFQYSQEYIEHGYIELVFPATENNEFCMAPNYLHIWPRDAFMMIGLPNPDGSFTGTLFMPFEDFEKIKTPDDLISFYETNFPDSIPVLGKELLVKVFFNNKPSSLISIKCSPYHYSNRLVVMGDAAHAMVPFYGQGMNCGFEDCLVFDDLMTQYKCDLSKVLPEFTRQRCVDDHAIIDLAMKNYIEMRHSVNTVWFLMRKKIDNFLHWLFPNSWVPLYTMVSFTRTPYSKCVKDREWQDKVLTWTLVLGGLGISAGTICALMRTNPSNLMKFIKSNTFSAFSF